MSSASTSKSMESKEDSFGKSDNLTFVDFMPDCIKQPGVFKRPKYNDFRSLIEKANEWLKNYPEYEIVKCETVHFKIEGFNKIDYQNVLYTEYGKDHDNYYLKGLRMWVIRNTCIQKKQFPQIGYFDMIPARTKEGGIFSDPEFETLESMINSRNEVLRKQPFPGRIITIETQEIILEERHQIHPEKSMHYVGHIGFHSFVNILRIFYEIAEPRFEEIGIADFIPDIVEKKWIFMPKFETFSKVVHKASCWCVQQRDIRICNIQTIQIRLNKNNSVKSSKMSSSRSSNMRSAYVRILRIPFVRIPSSENSDINKRAIQQLTCKNFLPAQLTSVVLSFESLSQTKERISAWLKATGAKVLSAETVSFKTYDNFESNLESTLTDSVGEMNEQRVYILRIYLTDFYSEPPKEMLPPVPEIKSSCCIS